jgi:O-antigen/teichoic acid export membrane protein
MVSVIIGAIVNIIANLIFIPMFQAAGAAIGTFLAEFFVWFYQSYSVRKELPMFKNIMVCTPIVIAGMAMALLLDGMGLFFDSNIISLVLKALIGAVFFSGIVGGYLLLLKRKNGDIIY